MYVLYTIVICFNLYCAFINFRSAIVIATAFDVSRIVALDDFTKYALQYLGRDAQYAFVALGIIDIIFIVGCVIGIIRTIRRKKEDNGPKPDMSKVERTFTNGVATTSYHLHVGSVFSINENGTPIQQVLPDFVGKTPTIDLRVKDDRIFIYADGVHIGYVQNAYQPMILNSFAAIDHIEGFAVDATNGVYAAEFTLIVKG